MKHGITFKTMSGAVSVNTWTDWKISPMSVPVFKPPAPKTIYVDIPGADGQIDLTESLTGEVKYSNRKGSFDFRVLNTGRWEEVYSTIMDFLHGQRMIAILDDDPSYYYVGRFEVNQWKSNAFWNTISIDYNVDPYKYSIQSTTEDWLWDPFNFSSGVIANYNTIAIDGSYELNYSVARRSVIPTITITTTDSIVISHPDSGYTATRATGTYTDPSLILRSTDEQSCLVFTGTGTVAVDYRNARL